MADTQTIFVNDARIAEFWAAVKTALAGKANLSDLTGYTTPDAVATAITSALTNYATTAGVQTEIATALVDYMTKTQTEDAIAKAIADAAGLKFETAESLPETGTPNVIYLVPNGSEGNNVKDEFMWVDGKWELLGSTSIDLTKYWSKEELRIMTTEELQAILV